MNHEMAAGKLAHKDKPKEKGKKKVESIHVKRNKGEGGGYIATHQHENMEPPEDHYVPQGGMDAHMEQHMGEGEEAGAQ